MKKTKITGKGKTAKKKSRKAAKSTKKEELNPEATRIDIALMVQSSAREIAEAVIEEAKKGQLTPAKYLLEVGGVYPAAVDGSLSVSAREESLAETLLNRLNIPTTPLKMEEDEEPVILPPFVKRDVTIEEETKSQESEELVLAGVEE